MLTYNSSFNAHDIIDIIYHFESGLNFHQKTEIINISIIIIHHHCHCLFFNHALKIKCCIKKIMYNNFTDIHAETDQS